ncbi:PREDICTED: uncharacterized protein LOC104825781 [Tarenaya hassleriana]|uniref:uncharacterized protein LOC104825781 n=1 Tax=Tarenaya hassleriana TaxID=28532 RepID=UPI00053C4763|nr:PREDICTED: uncharacterized protein LOC104825781 [Tarenaya hassleriana]
MKTLKTQRPKPTIRRRRSNKLTNVSRERNLGTCCGGGGGRLSEKLRALKRLVPRATADVVVDDGGATEELFRETADYIIRLRKQVLALQKLVEIYGSDDDHANAVL